MYYINHLNQLKEKYTTEYLEKPINFQDITIRGTRYLMLKTLKENKNGLNLNWHQFRIPKASGGFREITAPSNDLKEAQKIIVSLLKEDLKILESNWSYAYVEGRNSMKAIEKHQENNSKWFLKLDIKNFFDSINLELINETINEMYPTCTFDDTEKKELLEFIDLFCTKDGKTPQGAISSPFISNWVISKFLYRIYKKIESLARNNDIIQVPKQRYIITCYADDIVISAKKQFNWKILQDEIQEILEPYFKLNKAKTHYGNSSGRNHILGKTLNKENNITPGHHNIRKWKGILFDLTKRINGTKEGLSPSEKRSLYGKMKWDFNTKQSYLEYLLKKYETKYTSGKSIRAYLTK